MNKLHWINWFDRVRLTFICSYLFLLLGAIYPWYKLPPLLMEAYGIDTVAIFSIFRIVSFILSIIVFILCLQRGQQNKILRIIVWMSLCIVLLFPYIVMIWLPKVAFIASNSYTQQISIIEHVEANFPEVQSQWKNNISLRFNSEPQSVFFLKILDSRFFQISSWDKFIIEGLGYNPPFFTLIGHGWGLTIIGLCITLTAIYLSIKENRLKLFAKDISITLFWYGLVLTTILTSIVFFNIVDYQLNTLFARGEYQTVLSISQIIEKLYPPLLTDSDFLVRKSKANFYVRPSEEYQIDFVKGLEYLRVKEYLKAEFFFQNALNHLDKSPNSFLVRAYLNTALVNKGINDFNNKKINSAIDSFRKSLLNLPGELSTLYALMISENNNQSLDKAADIAQMIIDNQKYFQFPSLALLGQCYVHLTWNSYQKNNLNDAWLQYRKSIDQKSWGKK